MLAGEYDEGNALIDGAMEVGTLENGANDVGTFITGAPVVSGTSAGACETVKFDDGATEIGMKNGELVV